MRVHHTRNYNVVFQADSSEEFVEVIGSEELKEYSFVEYFEELHREEIEESASNLRFPLDDYPGKFYKLLTLSELKALAKKKRDDEVVEVVSVKRGKTDVEKGMVVKGVRKARGKGKGRKKGKEDNEQKSELSTELVASEEDGPEKDGQDKEKEGQEKEKDGQEKSADNGIGEKRKLDELFGEGERSSQRQRLESPLSDVPEDSDNDEDGDLVYTNI